MAAFDEQAYLNSIKTGERVVETGSNCMTGMRGSVYIATGEMTAGSVCVKWDNGMGTSLTHGTRRIADAGESDKPSPGRRAYEVMEQARKPFWQLDWESLHWESRLHWERFADLYSKPIGPLGMCGCCLVNPATETICLDCIEKHVE